MRVFGYGSLVNCGTHRWDAEPAVLNGWRRVWVPTAERPAAFLSVERAQGSHIEGVFLNVPQSDMAALDLRETRYDRIDVPGGIVYSVPERNMTDGSAPILQSYLDVVLQGFDSVFGSAGVERFLATTHGWDAGIYQDRDAPVYPRAIPLRDTFHAEQLAACDAKLGSVPVVEKL
ncbi:MAG: gamma-glutamylcyclotransferase family protein [Pseudomonadota bacterium]